VSAHFLEASDGVVVAELVREGIVESLHHGVVAVVDDQGSTLLEQGNADAVVYPRSTLKPIQSLAILATGIKLSPLEITLMTSSHCGSRDHREAVGHFLTTRGLSADHLQCPEDWPLGAAERAEMVRDGEDPSRVAMNCSGKHAGFLAACVHQGWDLDTYLDPAHPLQQEIRATIIELSGETPAFGSTDGCGAPLHALSVRALATAIARISGGQFPHSSTLVDAVGQNAWALDGRGRDNTVVIERIGGVAKIGAEGLVVIGTPGGVAVAVKILDGSMRATTPVALAALAAVGAISDAIRDELTERVGTVVTGGDITIGGLRTSR